MYLGREIKKQHGKILIGINYYYYLIIIITITLFIKKNVHPIQIILSYAVLSKKGNSFLHFNILVMLLIVHQCFLITLSRKIIVLKPTLQTANNFF
jgi:hypothetical protein